MLSKYGYDYSTDGESDFYFYIKDCNLKFEEFSTRPIESYIKDTITMYEDLIKAEKALEQYAK